MQKKVLPQVLLLLLVLASCFAWMIYRYETDFESVPMVRQGRKTSLQKWKTGLRRPEKFPINLGLDLKGGMQILLELCAVREETRTAGNAAGASGTTARRSHGTALAGALRRRQQPEPLRFHRRRFDNGAAPCLERLFADSLSAAGGRSRKHLPYSTNTVVDDTDKQIRKKR